MMDKMLIVVPNLGSGGQERVAVNIAELLGSDYEITICTFTLNEQAYFPTCNVISMDIPSTNNPAIKIINCIKRMLRLRRYVEQEHIKYVISISASAGILNIGLGKNVICMTQEHGYRAVNKGILAKMVYKRANCITACSKGLCDAIKTSMPIISDKCFPLYNPNMIDEIYMKSKEKIYWEPEQGYKYIVSCGRLEEVKNYPRLIKAFKLFVQKHEKWKLLLIGDGTDRKKLEMLARDLELDKYIEFVGMQTNPFAYMAKCELFVLSSYNEGLPNSLIEGMCFCPVVSVDCLVGPKEILSDDASVIVDEPVVADYGIMVPAAHYGYEKSMTSDINEDDISLYKGMCIIVEDKELYYRLYIQGKKRVAYFDGKRYRERILQIIDNVTLWKTDG
ncbi:MAG: glycosyltransferase [Butyrivibrio sp.]|nr:glycosyltransferase [Butyrivibrio sp.]